MVSSPKWTSVGGFLFRGGTAQDGPNARHQFPRVERFGYVVVGADVQAQEFVSVGAAGCQHDDRDARLGPEQPADVSAVELGQQQIEDDQVRLLPPRHIQRLLAVIGDQDTVSVSLEIERNQIHDLLVIVDDEDCTVHKSSYHHDAG